MLHKHVDPEALVRSARHRGTQRNRTIHSLAYGSRYATSDIPKYHLAEKCTQPNVAYQLIHDELELDGRPLMNCASFVQTWMEPEAERLMVENMNKNLADQDEYPATQRIHARCVSILSHVWKIPKGQSAVGTATTGSSEAIMLGGLAMKRRWVEKRKREGKDYSRPNIIFGANAQVALEKFACYFDVEERLVPVSQSSRYCLDPGEAIKMCDENTIGMILILGSTYTGHFEPVEEMSRLLDEFEERTGHNIPIHIDGASGGLVAPFCFPDLKWSFDVKRVVSINTSGHKYGLVYPGVGWVVWKSEEFLPKGLVFELHYLGGSEQTYTLNFSRSAAPVIGQYYNFIRLGYEGYASIHNNSLENSRLLASALENSGYYEVVSDAHRPKGLFYPYKHDGKSEIDQYNEGLPVVAFKLTDEFCKEYPGANQDAVSGLLRMRGWIVPNYPLPPNEEKTSILRVVVRESMTEDLVDRFIEDIIWATEMIMKGSDSLEVAMLGLSAGTDPALAKHRLDLETIKPNTYSRQC